MAAVYGRSDQALAKRELFLYHLRGDSGFCLGGDTGAVQRHLSDYLCDHPFGYIGLLRRIDVDWIDRHHPSTDLRGYR